MLGTQTCSGVSCSTEAMVLGFGCFSASFSSSPLPFLPLVSPTCSTVTIGIRAAWQDWLHWLELQQPHARVQTPWGRGSFGGALKGKEGTVQASVEVCRELPFPVSQQ